MLAGGGHGLNCRVYTSAGDTCNQSVGGWWMAGWLRRTPVHCVTPGDT